MLVCNMRWEDVGPAGEEGKVGGEQSTREISNPASYGRGGTLGGHTVLAERYSNHFPMHGQRNGCS